MLLGCSPTSSNVTDSSSEFQVTTPPAVQSVATSQSPLSVTPHPAYEPVVTQIEVSGLQEGMVDVCMLSGSGQPTRIALAPEGAELVANTKNICFFLFPDSLQSETVLNQADDIQSTLERVAGRMEVNTPSLVAVNIEPPDDKIVDGNCPLRGYFASGTNEITVRAGAGTPISEFHGIAGHELGHLVSEARFGTLFHDVIIVEGLATWLSSETWNEWRDIQSLDDAVRGFISQDTYVPLSQAYEVAAPALSVEDCLAQRDTKYTEWASFVGYLIETYGIDSLETLWRASRDPNSSPEGFDASYQSVYGKPIDILEKEWLAHLG